MGLSSHPDTGRRNIAKLWSQNINGANLIGCGLKLGRFEEPSNFTSQAFSRPIPSHHSGCCPSANSNYSSEGTMMQNMSLMAMRKMARLHFSRSSALSWVCKITLEVDARCHDLPAGFGRWRSNIICLICYPNNVVRQGLRRSNCFHPVHDVLSFAMACCLHHEMNFQVGLTKDQPEHHSRCLFWRFAIINLYGTQISLCYGVLLVEYHSHLGKHEA